MPEVLTQTAEAKALAWLEAAAETARASHCLRRKCGSVLVSAEGEVFAPAVNQLPPGAEVHCDPYCLDKAFKSDKACCVHAEQRTVMAALKEGRSLAGSTMVFASVDEVGARLKSGSPYCTICSKMALEAGVGYWILEHEHGVTRYGALEYNRISFEYKG